MLAYLSKQQVKRAVTNSAVTCWHICQNSEARSDEALQTLQTLHIFESQARVRIYIIINTPFT